MNKLLHFKLKLVFAIVLGLLAFIAVVPNRVFAQIKDYSFAEINVDIQVNQDSTMSVTEELIYRFNGEFHGVYRDITLVDHANTELCKADPSLQCGGFEYINIDAVYDNEGRLLEEDDDYTLERIYDSYTDEERLKIRWEFSKAGRNFNDETFRFTVKYTVYGGIGYFPEEGYDLFYWNAIFADREKIAERVDVDITFPVDIGLQVDDLQVFGSSFNYEWLYDPATASLSLTTEKLLPYEQFTVMVKFPGGIVKKYASLQLNLDPEIQDVVVNGVPLDDISGDLGGIPPGDVALVFSQNGYKKQEVELFLAEGEEKALNINLQPSLWTIIKRVALVVCNILGCLLLPGLLFWMYRKWNHIGRDLNKRETIVPFYHAPEDIRPSMLGTIKDEHVDIVDITATIIDVAYRGYIKIREFEQASVFGLKISAKNFELIKLKDFADLETVEQKIMRDIFGDKERVTTNDLKNKFYRKIPDINEELYKEMVNKGYFSERPDKVRSKYAVAAGGILFLGIVSIFANALLPIFVTFAMSLITAAIVMFFVARHMPAKTAKGTKVLEEILGFKMYMETAERYRVQNLTPETFEKFLSYAIVFGIEEKWAEKFKDIYKQKPDWYESNNSHWNSIYLAHALSDFRSTTSTTMVSAPSSSGSKGGGWSGGGGFSGGFSGGGGGGGGGGAW